MAGNNAISHLKTSLGNTRKLYYKSTDLQSKFQNAISTFDDGLTTNCRGNIRYAVNNLSASVGHGHASFGTVEKYVEQLPLSAQSMITAGMYGFICGIARPFLAANTYLYIPKSETEYNYMVTYIMDEVAKDIMNLETFIKENIPDDVIWRDKMIELVTKAYQLGKGEKCQ